MLVMTGRVTMLGLSRWAGKGGSSRTIQRFFSQALPWATLFWVFFRQQVYRPEDVYLLAGDEVVVTKAGKHTHGLDRFFANLYGKPVPGLSFFTLSLVSTQERRSFPIGVEQVVRSAAEQAASKAKAEAKKQQPSTATRRPGRPKGSKNTNKTARPLTPELVRIKALIEALLHCLTGMIPLSYLVLDGHFGHAHVVDMARQCHLHHLQAALRLGVVPALRRPLCRSWPTAQVWEQGGVPSPARPVSQRDDRRRAHPDPQIPAQLLHKEFAHPLNVVILVKTNLHTRAWAQVILFSSALDLPYNQIVEFYGLRFQIEFNFRDAKQYWGLEDFMNVTPTGVTNAANLSLFMVNVAYRLRTDIRQRDPDCSVLDLKADYRGYKYVAETIPMLPEKPEPVLLAKILNQVARLGRIHASQPSFRFA